MNAKERKAKQAVFLDTLRNCASVRQACEQAGVPRSTIYDWKSKSATFAKAFDEANEDANDAIEDEIVRRGKDGVDEPLTSMGRPVYEEIPELDRDGNPVLDRKGNPKYRQGKQIFVKKYSDTLLLARAKSRMKKYRDRVDLDLLEQINQNTGGTLSLNTRGMTSEELATLKQIAQSMKARQENQEQG